MDEWVWWIVAAGVLAVGEIATLGFFLGPIAVAAALAAVVALAGGSLAVQWIVFVAASLATLLVLRPIARPRHGPRTRRRARRAGEDRRRGVERPCL